MIFLHNITKQIFNETDIDDFVCGLDADDLIKFTEPGNALIKDFSELDKYTKEQIFETYLEYTGNIYEYKK